MNTDNPQKRRCNGPQSTDQTLFLPNIPTYNKYSNTALIAISKPNQLPSHQIHQPTPAFLQPDCTHTYQPHHLHLHLKTTIEKTQNSIP